MVSAVRSKIVARFCLPIIAVCSLVLIHAPTPRAHEFLIKPAQLRVESGARVSFRIMATHFFMVDEEAEPANTVKAWLAEGDKNTNVEFKENPALKTLQGTATVQRKGTAILVAHLQEPVDATKIQGSNRSQRIKREKFAKALVTVTADDDGYKKALGHKLEIVPVSNVTKAKAGEELSFRILLDGKPLRGQVQATYDGFSRRSMTFAYATEALEDGVAHVKVTNHGLWMIRVEKRLETNAKDFDLLGLKATLVFSFQ
jgi:uncharacterized GH25 family protein